MYFYKEGIALALEFKGTGSLSEKYVAVGMMTSATLNLLQTLLQLSQWLATQERIMHLILVRPSSDLGYALAQILQTLKLNIHLALTSYYSLLAFEGSTINTYRTNSKFAKQTKLSLSLVQHSRVGQLQEMHLKGNPKHIVKCCH